VNDAVPGPAAPAGPGSTAPSTRHGSVRAPRGSAKGAPTTFVLLRHGRTALTESGRFSGRTGADPPLSGAGLRDAERAAAVVAGLGRPGALFADLPAVSAVISSPMLRTRQTAAAVVAALAARDAPEPGATADRGPADGGPADGDPADGNGVEVDPDWIEAGFGVWEGLTYAELIRDHAADLDRWQGSTSFAPPGGDSLDAVAERVCRARARTVAAHPGRTVVVVTHAGPVRIVVREALDAGPAALWRTRVGAGSLTVIRYWVDGGVELVTMNATAHLV
jgi:ribonuclease H / adenosylcobalamin/alpha-ribazole phosphatase